MVRRPLRISIMMLLLLKHIIVVRIEYLKSAKEIYALISYICVYKQSKHSCIFWY